MINLGSLFGQSSPPMIGLDISTSGVRLVEIKPAETTPALVLAYRRFGDATRAGEVVQRNRITHPGFVPPLPLKVARW